MARGIACFIFILIAAIACSDSESSAPAPIVPPNAAPTANAGVDQTAAEGAAVMLNGTASADVDGAVATFSWMQTAGPTVSLSGATAARPTFQAPLVAAPTSATFALTVTDDDGAASSDSVTVTLEPAPRGQIVEIETTFDGVARAFSVYTPTAYQAGAPAVLLLHGGGQSMREVLRATSTASRWLDLADQEGFLVIAPNGYNEGLSDGLGDQQSWNDIRDDQSGATSLQDDVGFILNVLEQIDVARAFDAARVFATGSSNGGIMTMRLVVERPQDFFGAATFIAALPEEMIPDPLAATPIMLLNGTDDPLVLFDGGPVNDTGAPTRSVPDTLDYFLRSTDADRASAATRMLADVDPGDGCEIFETIYTTLVGGPAVTFYEAQGGGHSIPDPDAEPFPPAAAALLGPRCRDVNGVDLAFAFFQLLL